MLAADAELGLRSHAVNLLAHLVEGGVDAVTLGLRILGDGVLDGDARLVEHGMARAHALHQFLPGEPDRRGRLRLGAARAGGIDQPGVGDQLGQHHGDGLERLDLHLGIAALLDVLDREHAHRPLAPDDRHAREAAEALLARLRPISEVRMARRLVEVQHLHGPRDRADQPFAERQLGDVHRRLIEPAGGVKLQHAFAQQVDRADLAVDRLADDLHHLVQLRLRRRAASHHIVQPGQDLARGSGGGGGHGQSLAGGRRPRHPPITVRPSRSGEAYGGSRPAPHDAADPAESGDQQRPGGGLRDGYRIGEGYGAHIA